MIQAALSLLLPSLAAEEPGPLPSAPETLLSPHALRVRAAPSTDSAVVGLIAANAPFLVLLRVPGPACGSEGSPSDTVPWGIVPGGYACLGGTTAADEKPSPLPHLVPFDAPTPDEYRSYVSTGSWPRDPATTEALTPFIYGKSWRHWDGETYADLGAWDRGDGPLTQIESGAAAHFIRAIETLRGPVLELPGGAVVPLDDVYIYPVSRFHGVEITGEDALSDGELQAWVHVYGGASLRALPTVSSEKRGTLPFQTAVRVTPTADPHWLRTRDGGFIASSTLRRALPQPRPEGLPPEALWIDVDVAEQVLMLLQGERLVFATMVSTGLTDKATPPGVYTLSDKAIYADMGSRADAAPEETYLVEAVPWIMHFAPRYALHVAFWHWGFGNRASHGCVNMAPLDARRIFDAVSPYLPDGWSSATSGAGSPVGTTIRIR